MTVLWVNKLVGMWYYKLGLKGNTCLAYNKQIYTCLAVKLGLPSNKLAPQAKNSHPGQEMGVTDLGG